MLVSRIPPVQVLSDFERCRAVPGARQPKARTYERLDEDSVALKASLPEPGAWKGSVKRLVRLMHKPGRVNRWATLRTGLEA